MNRLFLFPMLFALTGLVFALTLGLSPDTAHSAAPDDDDDDEWEELTEAQLNWRHGPKNNHLGVRLPAFGYQSRISLPCYTYFFPAFRNIRGVAGVAGAPATSGSH